MDGARLTVCSKVRAELDMRLCGLEIRSYLERPRGTTASRRASGSAVSAPYARLGFPRCVQVLHKPAFLSELRGVQKFVVCDYWRLLMDDPLVPGLAGSTGTKPSVTRLLSMLRHMSYLTVTNTYALIQMHNVCCIYVCTYTTAIHECSAHEARLKHDYNPIAYPVPPISSPHLLPSHRHQRRSNLHDPPLGRQQIILTRRIPRILHLDPDP